MKNISLIFCLCLVALISCKKDETPPSSLIGTWVASVQTLPDCDSTYQVQFSSSICTDSSSVDCIYNSFTFNANGSSSSFTALNDSGTLQTVMNTGNYTDNGTTFEFCTQVSGCQMYTYTISGNEIVMTWIQPDGCLNRTLATMQ